MVDEIFPKCFLLSWSSKTSQKDSLGRTGRGDEERMLPSMSVTSWSAWIRMNKELTESLWVRITGKAGTGDVIVGICYRPPHQED